MVKKLIKHEFIYYLRTFGMFLPIVLVVGLMTRVFRFFDSENVISQIVISSSFLILFVACMALIMLATVVSVVRFYKNMYSAEGYLTFTLPVTNTEHIFVKLLAAMVCQIVCVLTVIAAVSIALSGELFGEMITVLSYFINKIFLACGTVNLIGFIIEIILLAIISAASTLLLYYACITVGQTAKKNRIFAAVGAYFVYYVATQIISTVFTIIFMILGMTGALDSVMVWFESNVVAGVHIVLCSVIVISAVITAVFWIVTQTIMSKKLNLE